MANFSLTIASLPGFSEDPQLTSIWPMLLSIPWGHHPMPEGLHEILLGLLPQASQTAEQLLKQARPWIEPAQSYEKNQLGLKQMLRNSLRLAWTMGLLADTVVLLRAHLLLNHPPQKSILQELMPRQMALNKFGSKYLTKPPHYQDS